MGNSNYYGHSGSNEDKSDWQPLIEHLEGVAKLASEFAKDFGFEDLAYTCGLLHDIGKYSEAFQRRLEGNPNKVDHSTAGAIEAIKKYNDIGKLMAYIISGHHGGLPDYENGGNNCLAGRLSKKDLEDYSSWKEEINELPKISIRKINASPKRRRFAMANMVRMLHSCVVDADFLDTEKSFGSESSKYRDNPMDLGYVKKKLDSKIEEFKLAPPTHVNLIRKSVLERCTSAADNGVGLYSLTVPTGGGKTISSMKFAVEHAIKNDLKRIIYVVPYTSIIEQNSKVFRDIIGEEYVLEHHSNSYFEPDEDDENDYSRKMRLSLATQNWDAQVIVTTNVQFLESFFSCKNSQTRKLHNVSNSVVIFDEAQMLPQNLLIPTVALLEDLVNNYNTSIVLCTATQPVLGQFFECEKNVIEIIEDPVSLASHLKRVDFCYFDKEISDDDLIDQLSNKHTWLCIVNTRKHAKELYQACKSVGMDNVFHLSAKMCPRHRSSVINDIKDRLDKGLLCRVISTQLIEAGVDIDFPLVYRAMAGLDSITQAAGRCNREGKLKDIEGKSINGELVVFEPKNGGIPKGYISLCASKTRSVIRMFDKQAISLEGIKRYFELLFDAQGEELDRKNIMDLYNFDSLNIQFREISESYKIIENTMVSIIVPYKESGEGVENLVIELRRGINKKVMKKLQGYTVQVYQSELAELKKIGTIESIHEGINYLLDDNYYSLDLGVVVPNFDEEIRANLIF